MNHLTESLRTLREVENNSFIRKFEEFRKCHLWFFLDANFRVSASNLRAHGLWGNNAHFCQEETKARGTKIYRRTFLSLIFWGFPFFPALQDGCVAQTTQKATKLAHQFATHFPDYKSNTSASASFLWLPKAPCKLEHRFSLKGIWKQLVRAYKECHAVLSGPTILVYILHLVQSCVYRVGHVNLHFSVQDGNLCGRVEPRSYNNPEPLV